MFQSTLPVRGATPPRVVSSHHCVFQSTLPVRGATAIIMDVLFYQRVSIHAPREGSDQSQTEITAMSRCFNPRSP